MKKNFLILIISLVIISLFNTSKVSFSLWDKPNFNTAYIHMPDLPITLDTDISVFGLFVNFFSDPVLDYSINKISAGNKMIISSDIISEKHNNFSIQFAALDTQIKSFPGIDNFDIYEENGLIHYTTGNFSSLSLAKERMYNIRELGFLDAFVFTFNNDERVCYFIVKKEKTFKKTY